MQRTDNGNQVPSEVFIQQQQVTFGKMLGCIVKLEECVKLLEGD